jgi:hypothetical protein
VYSARWGDFLARHVDHARSEQFVYSGWVTPLLALVGFAFLLQARRFALAALLALGAVIPALLALGTHVPLYSVLWHALPPFRFPRVPERLLPIAALCLAALVAFAIARVRARAVVVSVLAIALLFVDLHVRAYGKSFADSSDSAYAALANAPRGRLLELPVFDPGVHYGSVYLWYDTRALRQRPGGYSTTAPKSAKALADRLQRLNCGDWSGDTAALVRRLGVTVIALHFGLFVRSSAVPDRASFAWLGLVSHGWKQRQAHGSIWTFVRGASHPKINTPATRGPVFCEGWYGEAAGGRYMSETHAPFWVAGSGRIRLRFAPSPLPRTFTVDGRTQRGAMLSLGKRGWHVITVDVPHLVPGPGHEVGLRLLGVTTYPSRGSRSRRTGSSP